MGVGIFLDKEHRPSRKEMERTLGKRWELFLALTAFLRDGYQLQGEMSYGGKNYGWNLWYRKSGRTLVNLFPRQGYLVAQVVLGKEQAEGAAALPLGRNAKEVFSRAPRFHDGRWLYIPVKTKRDAIDVQELIRLKRKPTPAQR